MTLQLIIFFFSLIVFGGTEVPVVNILLCHPSEDSLQGSAIPDGCPSKDWQSTVGWGDAGFEPRTAVLQSGVATNEPPLLPIILHYSDNWIAAIERTAAVGISPRTLKILAVLINCAHFFQNYIATCQRTLLVQQRHANCSYSVICILAGRCGNFTATCQLLRKSFHCFLLYVDKQILKIEKSYLIKNLKMTLPTHI